MKAMFKVNVVLWWFLAVTTLWPAVLTGEELTVEPTLPNENLRLPDTALSMGAARYTVPIDVPPGRNAMTPDLSLAYNSGAGNGLLGVGWALNTGYIRCSIKEGFTCESFEVMENGRLSELAPRPQWGAGYWGAVIENEFTRYLRPAHDHEGWTAVTRDGRLYRYGATADSRVGDHKWLLDKIEDPNGNTITYTYDDSARKRLIRIDYTGNRQTDSEPFAAVTFSYQRRKDVFVDHLEKRGGPFTHRLRAVTTTLNNQRVRRYVLDYSDYATETGRSVIRAVHRYGAGNSQRLPSQRFTYKGGGKGTYTGNGTISLPYNILTTRIRHKDLNGDGIGDIYQQTRDKIKIWYPDSAGQVSSTAVMDVSAKAGYSFADLNGDGHADLMKQGHGVFTPHINDGHGNFIEKGDGGTLWETPLPPWHIDPRHLCRCGR